MVIIFGFGPGEAKDLGEVAPLACPNCHNEVFLHHLQSKKAVRLYFVPVVPYGTNEYLLCPICHQGVQLNNAQLPAVEQMKARTALFRRGQVPVDFYRTQAAQFWPRVGVVTRPAPTPGPPPTVLPPQAGGSRPVVQAGPSVPARPPAAAAAPGPSLAERLADLGRLHADGVLTDDEFVAAKRRMLGG